MKTAAKLWIGLLALVVLSPLGLILPARLGAGSVSYTHLTLPTTPYV